MPKHPKTYIYFIKRLYQVKRNYICSKNAQVTIHESGSEVKVK